MIEIIVLIVIIIAVAKIFRYSAGAYGITGIFKIN